MKAKSWNGRGQEPASSPFTLTELLVVIAIIAVLASLLLPGLSKARDFAKSASCMSCMKQLATCGVLYMGDFSDFIPWAGCVGSSEEGKPSDTIYRDPKYGWLALYMNLGGWDSDASGIAQALSPRSTGVTCPSFPRPWGKQAPYRCAWQNGNYVLNCTIAYTYLSSACWTSIGIAKLGALKGSLSGKMFATEIMDDGNYMEGNKWSMGWNFSPLSRIPYIDKKHGGHANFLFVDGHTEGLAAFPMSSLDPFWAISNN